MAPALFPVDVSQIEHSKKTMAETHRRKLLLRGLQARAKSEMLGNTITISKHSRLSSLAPSSHSAFALPTSSRSPTFLRLHLVGAGPVCLLAPRPCSAPPYAAMQHALASVSRSRPSPTRRAWPWCGLVATGPASDITRAGRCCTRVGVRYIRAGLSLPWKLRLWICQGCVCQHSA